MAWDYSLSILDSVIALGQREMHRVRQRALIKLGEWHSAALHPALHQLPHAPRSLQGSQHCRHQSHHPQPVWCSSRSYRHGAYVDGTFIRGKRSVITKDWRQYRQPRETRRSATTLRESGAPTQSKVGYYSGSRPAPADIPVPAQSDATTSPVFVRRTCRQCLLLLQVQATWQMRTRARRRWSRSPSRI